MPFAYSLSARRPLKRILKMLGVGILRDLVVLFIGWIRFRKSGITPARAHQALVSLFCQTGGTSNDLFHTLIVRRRPPVRIQDRGILGLEEQQLPQIVSQLRERGYYVFERKLPRHLCHRLLEFALAEKALVRGNQQSELETYDRKNPKGVRYDFSEEAVLRSD